MKDEGVPRLRSETPALPVEAGANPPILDLSLIETRRLATPWRWGRVHPSSFILEPEPRPRGDPATARPGPLPGLVSCIRCLQAAWRTRRATFMADSQVRRAVASITTAAITAATAEPTRGATLPT
jgi:hypothetical protein